MGVVSEEEQGRRAGGLMIFMLSGVLAIPALGMLAGLVLLIPLVQGIFITSSNRLADFGILLAFIVAYIASFYFGVVSMDSIAMGIVLPFIVSFIGLSYFLKKR